MASSEIEFSSPLRPTWENKIAGKASLDMILKNAAQDRYTSKKISKQLVDSDGRPEVLRRRYMWGCRFKTFRKETLQAEYEPSSIFFSRVFSKPLSPSYLSLTASAGILLIC